MDPHILNFYEDMEFELADVPSLILRSLTGRLADAKEKLDGQNFTFTVDAIGAVRFMGKGCPKWIRQRNGLGREELSQHYADRPQVQLAFVTAFDVIQASLRRVPDHAVHALFAGGTRVVDAEVVSTINPNIVSYKRNAVCLLGCHDIGTKLGQGNHTQPLLDLLSHIGSVEIAPGWILTGVPSVEFKGNVDDGIQAADRLTREFMNVVSDTLHHDVESLADLRMVDLAIPLIARHIEPKLPELRDSELLQASARLAHDDAGYFKRSLMTLATWRTFKELDDQRGLTVGDAMAPIERFFRRWGAMAIESYRFSLADVEDAARPTELRGFVSDVRTAVAEGRIQASEIVRRRISSALNRLDESMFTKNVEGIVFPWRGKLRKLTGPFTAINRLHGLFMFDDPARII